MYNDDDIIAWAKKFSSEAPNVAPAPSVSHLLERMRGGTLGQESGGNYRVRRNARTGAIGGFQVLPANIPSWTEQHYGKRLTPDEFERNPQAQDAVFTGEMGKYLRKAKRVAPDDDTAIRMAAAAWYGGEKAMRRYDNPRRFRADEPSFREYTQSVLKRTGKAPAPKAAGMSNDEINKIFGDVDKVLGSNNQDVFAEVDKVLKTPITPQQPVPETPDTIALQRQAAADPKVKSRNGVLLNPGETPDPTEWPGFGQHMTPDGRAIMVHQDNAKKHLKLKTPSDIDTFLQKNPHAVERIVGITEPVSDTSAGQPAVTARIGNNEAASAVVTNPAAAHEQAQVYQEQFPNAEMGLTSTDKVMQDRIAKLMQVGQAAKQVPSGGGGRLERKQVRPQVAAPTLGKQYVGSEPVISDVDLDEQGNPLPMNQQTQLPQVSAVNANDEKQVNSAVAESFDIPKGMSESDATRYMTEQLRVKYGGGDFSKFKFFHGYKPGTTYRVTYGDLKNAGIDVNPYVRQKVVENRVENPQPNLDVSPKGFVITPQDIKDYTKDSRYGGDTTAAVAGSLIGSLGEVASIIPGLLSLDPATRSAEQILTNGGSRPNVKVNEGEFIERAREFYNNTQAIKEGTKLKDSPVTSTIIDLGAALPKLAVLSASAGGLIAGLAIEGAGLSGIRKDSPTSVIGNTTAGALNGLVFEIVPGAAKIIKTPFLRNGVEVAAISGSTYALGKLSGVPDDENFAASLAMGVMHLYGSYKKALVGKTIDARDADGNRLVVKYTEDNKIVTVAPDTKADIELFIPKNFKTYAAKDAKVQAEKQIVEDNPLFKDVAVNEKGETTYKGETEKEMAERRDLPNRLQNLTPQGLRNEAKSRQIDVSETEFNNIANDRDAMLEVYKSMQSTPKPAPQEKGFEVVEKQDISKDKTDVKPIDTTNTRDILADKKVDTSKPVVPPVEAKPEPPAKQPPSEPPVGEAKKPTSTKNAVVEAERIERKLSPIEKEAKREFGTAWDDAAQKLKDNPRAGDELVKQVLANPKPLSDADNALLLHKRIQSRTAYDQAAKTLNEAVDSNNIDAQAEARLALARASDELYDVDLASRKAGTETGRGLNARRMMANEDYTLAALETRKRAANGGRQLTDAERTQLQKVANAYKAQSDELEAHLAARENELAAMKTRAELAEAKVEQARPFIEKAEKFVEQVDKRAEAARERIKARGNVFAAGLDPLVLKDFADIGASHIAHLGLDFAKFSDAMIKEFGEKIKPHLDEIWNKARGLHKSNENTALKGIKTRLQNQIVDLEKQIQTKTKLTRFRNKVVYDAEATALQAKRDELKKQFTDIFGKPQMSDVSRLKAFKTRTENRIIELTKRLEEHNLKPKPKRPAFVLDREAITMKAELERIKRDFNREVRADAMKNRSTMEKGFDYFTKWRRFGVLSWPTTLAKLTSAAFQRMAFTPVEEVVGAGLGKLPGVRKVAEMAPREGGLSVKAEAKAVTAAVTKGMADAWRTLGKGSDIDVMFDKDYGNSWMEFPGKTHGALKSPPKRAEFERSFQKRVEQGIRQGIDVSNPLIQMEMMTGAYADAQRAILMNDSRMTRFINNGLRALEAPSKEGKVSLPGKATATAIRTVMPIVKVPINFVGESMQYAGGLVSGSYKLGKALRAGTETLSPEEADVIMRHLKKGSIGGALLLLGFFNPGAIGGYYQRGEKREKDEAQAGGIQLFGYNLPRVILHSPPLEMLQIGSTIRRVADSKFKKTDKDTKGIFQGIIEGATGLVKELPFIEQFEKAEKLLTPGERTEYVGELAKSIVVPGAIQWTANITDKDKDGNLIKRKPETLKEYIESGIPGLRQGVPQKGVHKGSVEDYIASPEFKHATTDDLVYDIQTNQNEEDRPKMIEALRKKAHNARKGGTLTQKEADAINALPEFANDPVVARDTKGQKVGGDVKARPQRPQRPARPNR